MRSVIDVAVKDVHAKPTEEGRTDQLDSSLARLKTSSAAKLIRKKHTDHFIKRWYQPGAQHVDRHHQPNK